MFHHIQHSDSPKCQLAAGRMSAVSFFLAFLLLIPSFAFFYYSDFSDTLDNSILLLECISDGSFSDYYHYCVMHRHPQTVYTANYGPILYLIFALWNLPTFLLHRLTGFDYMNSVGALLWCKLMILCAVIIASIILRKIVQLYTRNDQSPITAQQLFLGNSCMLLSSMIAVQYDILSLLLILSGLYAFLQNKHGWFLLLFAVAVPLKTFALFAFIPLLLLKEKRIPHILLNLSLVLSLDILSTLPFKDDPWYALCLKTQLNDAFELLFARNITIGGFSCNLFIAAFASVCIICYITDTHDLTHYMSVWAAGVPFLLFVVLTSIRSYWSILMTPFCVMLAYFNPRKLRINILLLIAGNFCYALHLASSHWIYSTSALVRTLLLKYVIPLPALSDLKYTSIQGLFNYYELYRYSQLFYPLFIISVFFLVILNLPFKSNTSCWQKHIHQDECWFAPMQSVCSCILIALFLYANLATNPPAVYSVPHQNTFMEESIADEFQIRQHFTATSTSEISEISFIARNTNTNRANRNALEFRILDAKTDEILSKTVCGVALIHDNSVTHVSLTPAHLLQGHPYILEIDSLIYSKPTDLYFSSSMLSPPNARLEINDQFIPGSLALDIR